MTQAFLEASWSTSFVAKVPSSSRPGLVWTVFGIFIPPSDETFSRWHYYCPCEDFMYRHEGERGAGDVCKHLSAALIEWTTDQQRKPA